VPSEQKVITHVEGHGWSVANIEERGDSVGWSFTVGLFENYKHPEVIIFGMSHDSRHRILNWIGDNVTSGVTQKRPMMVTSKPANRK
jgi:hypothetical protein